MHLGHEICWRCGKDYVLPSGRRGHDFTLFPRPSNLQYCCNGWKQWTLRVGAVVLAVPALAVVAGVVVVALPIAAVVFGAAGIYRAVRWIRAHRMRQMWMQEPRYVSRECEAYYQGRAEMCISCTGHMACSEHVYAESSYVCSRCLHYNGPVPLVVPSSATTDSSGASGVGEAPQHQEDSEKVPTVLPNSDDIITVLNDH
jgi:hypothetical protein